MSLSFIQNIFSEWSSEINKYLSNTNTLCVALFSDNKELIFATPVMKSLFKGDPSASFINPTFDALISLKNNQKSLVFNGMLTLGDYISDNHSIVASVFIKNEKMLVIGGVETEKLFDQYLSMHQLNNQINNLQRELIKEKLILEKILNELNEKNNELQLLNASKDKFFSIIGHDLKAPFNSIIGLSDLLLEQIKEKNYDEMEYYGELIIKSSNKAMDLLQNLMEWSRSQTGRIVYNPELFDIVDSIHQMNFLFGQIAEQKSIKIISNLPIKLSILGDKEMINTILRNLISNAIKFTKSGGEIVVSLNAKQDQVIISVRDNGVGISKNSIEKLFKIDESYSTPGTNKETGTGLGLILCKEFIDKHNGSIWVESEEGKGSIFNFSLPYNSENETENTTLFLSNCVPQENKNKLKILIVEDDQISELLLQTYLKSLSEQILVAKAGIEAIELFRDHPDIDLILMDIRMPGLSGFETAKIIRQFNKNVIIIAQSAFCASEDIEKALEYGCNDFISKPVEKNKLIDLLKKYFKFSN